MFLCRENELNKLDTRYNGGKSEFIVVYGRRRVGKTALINEFTKNKKTIYYPALNTSSIDNLIALSRSIQNYINPEISDSPVYPSFDAAFAEISRIAKRERVIFVIDEFPYLAKAEPSIPSRLQHLLDHEWADSGLFLILCGSSMSFMEKEVLSEKSPLFGRRTAQFKIEPLSYLDTARFHPELENEDNALIYAITGGVPHYINKLDVHDSVRDALIVNFFDSSAYLFEEPENLLRQELREPAVYNSIIAAIAGGTTKLTNIAVSLGMESGKCSKYISVLSELGIVKKTEPVVDKSKRKVQYRISDPFFNFWFRFVPSNMMSISSGSIARVFDAAIGSYLNQYMGLPFEEICRQYLVNYAENLPFTISSIGEWWGHITKINEQTQKPESVEVQIDIVGIAPKQNNTREGRQYLIGSCKYTNDAIDKGELDKLKLYAEAFTSEKDTCYYYIFSKGGFTEGLKELGERGEVKLLTLDDIYGN